MEDLIKSLTILIKTIKINSIMVNQKKQKQLFEAVKENKIESVKSIIRENKNEIDINIPNEEEISVLGLAVAREY